MWDGAAAMGPRKPILNFFIFSNFILTKGIEFLQQTQIFLFLYLCKPMSLTSILQTINYVRSNNLKFKSLLHQLLQRCRDEII